MSGTPSVETKTEKRVAQPSSAVTEPVASNPDALEVSPGTLHEKLEGWIPQLAGETEIREALEKAFDYRGDVSITLKNGIKVYGFIFDRLSDKTLADFFVLLFLAGSDELLNV